MTGGSGAREFRGAVLTAGGSEGPLIHCLRQHRPDQVLFVVSQSSRAIVEEKVLPAIDYDPQREFLTLAEENDLRSVYDGIAAKIEEWIERSNLTPQEVFFDYTGGTKSMSAALVLACIERLPNFNYVSGERNKDGLGIVMSGTERHILGKNPWLAAGKQQRLLATEFYQRHNVEAASKLLEEASRVSDRDREGLRAAADFCRGLQNMQDFRFEKALGTIRHCRQKLEKYLTSIKVGVDWYPDLLKRLETLAAEAHSQFRGPMVETFHELLANAARCAHQARFDDATARLYRAFEMFGQNASAERFKGSRFGKIDLAKLELSEAQAMLQAFPEVRREGSRLPLPLGKTFECLELFGGEQYAHFGEMYRQVEKVLKFRNDSILAHGNQPVSEEAYRKLRQEMGAVLGIDEVRVQGWPVLRFE